MRAPTLRIAQVARLLFLMACASAGAPDLLRADDSSDVKIAGYGMATADGKTVLDGKTTLDGKTPPIAAAEPEPEYKNWIELGIGGLITNGDTAQFNQEHRISGDVYGGIQDLHYEQTLGKETQLTVDGHAIFDNNDFDVKVQLTQPKLGYIQAGFTEFRSWYDGNGGFFPHHHVFFSPPFPEMHIDRGEFWVELGLRIPDWPEITVRYEHLFRDGQKDSTIWGDTNLTGLTVNRSRKIAPAFRDIEEARDIFSLEATKNIGNTDVTLGMRYEHSNNYDTLELERGAGQLPPVVRPPGQQRFITQNDQNVGDLFSGHAITETHLSDSLWFTAGYSYTTLGSDLAGTRIFGTHYDAGFGEPAPTLGGFDRGYLNLAGTSQIDDHVFNANFLWMPLKDLTVLTAFRYTHSDKEADATFIDTTAKTIAAVPTRSSSAIDSDRFGETLELRYTGIENWLFYAESDWEEESIDRHERQVGGEEEPLNLNEDNSYITQKYSVGANWYPMTRLSVSAQYYHKIVDNDHEVGPTIHQRLLGQDWNTDDVNVRITCRPKIPACLGTLAIVSRYDFVRTTIDSKWEVFNDPDEILNEVQSGLITKHMFTESVTWNPLARLYFQTDFSYVLDQTDTPANSISLIPNASPTITNFRNDYWTVTSGAGYILDDKTDLHVDYSFYRANDYLNNDKVAQPYGMGATEHTLSASASRQITKNMRLLVKYSYFTYEDQTSGNHNNYEAHSIYSGLQVRF